VGCGPWHTSQSKRADPLGAGRLVRMCPLFGSGLREMYRISSTRHIGCWHLEGPWRSHFYEARNKQTRNNPFRHLPDHPSRRCKSDPALSEIRRFQSVFGRVVIHRQTQKGIPGQWRHLAPPHHLQYFTRRSLIRLLELEGFKVLRVKGQGAALDSRSGAQELPALISSLDRIITHWRFRPIATALNLLDEIEVLAVKPATSGPALSELRQA